MCHFDLLFKQEKQEQCNMILPRCFLEHPNGACIQGVRTLDMEEAVNLYMYPPA
jgi:hypothetical protein